MWSRIISTRSELTFPPSRIASVFARLSSQVRPVPLLLCDWSGRCQGRTASQPWLHTSHITLVLMNHPRRQSKGGERRRLYLGNQISERRRGSGRQSWSVSGDARGQKKPVRCWASTGCRSRSAPSLNPGRGSTYPERSCSCCARGERLP